MTPGRGALDLGGGVLGTALAEVVAAREYGDRWTRADRLLRAVCRCAVDSDAGSLFRGAPALAYVLHTAGDHPPYRAARDQVDAVVDELIRARLRAAWARIGVGRAPRLREFDLISGLTGLGALLLHTGRLPELLGEILIYLVALLDVPVVVDGTERPGWWTTDTPGGIPDLDGGHANFGMAHGVAGPVALLALCARAGHDVTGQRECLRRACGLLLRWAGTADPDSTTNPGHGANLPGQDIPDSPAGAGGAVGGVCWPETVDARTWDAPARATLSGRPSWCYGAPGIARALQLAAITSGHHGGRIVAELTLATCATSSRRAALGGGVCHGRSGLRLAVALARTDADPSGALARMALPPLTGHTDGTCPDPAGLLTGPDGVRLTGRTLDPHRPPPPRWETCLLLTAPT